MPELPDVELLKKYVDATALHKQISNVEIFDEQILNNTPKALQRQLTGHKFESTNRIGKYLIIDAGSDTWLILHFGMTGTLKYFSKANGYPEYTQTIFHFSDGGYLCYISLRKLGSIEATNDLTAFKKEKELGEDALDVDLQTFQSLLRNKRGMIKTALMDQSMIAGIGNAYSDEILFQCGIHPKTKVSALTDQQVKKLHSAMWRILKTAINNHAEPAEMPNNYLITHRNEEGRCPRCDSNIGHIKVAGRGCYICPHCQSKP
jgi:formamidopyrimidine-DNA glycosylase